MPNFLCKCGKNHNLSTWSSDVERMLLLEKSFHKAFDLISNTSFSKENVIDIFYEGEVDVVFCDACKRIYLYKGNGEYISYTVEN